MQQNLTLEQFYSAREALEEAARGKQIALIYYAGHGVQFNGRPYLLPSDILKPTKKHHLRLMEKGAISLDDLLVAADGKAEVTVAIIDACREIPDVSRFRSSLGGGETRGLSRPAGRGRSRLLAFSAGFGQLASDGPGEAHSPYTKHLLEVLDEKPDEEIILLFSEVASRAAKDIDSYPEVLNQGVKPGYHLASGALQVETPQAPPVIRSNPRLKISTSPPGADIYIDGAWEGKAPLELKLKPGAYSIEARAV